MSSQSENNFLHRIFQAIKRGLSPKPKQQYRTCGKWFKPSQLDPEGFCQECNRWGVSDENSHYGQLHLALVAHLAVSLLRNVSVFLPQ